MLGKEEQIKPNTSRRKKIMKARAEVNEIENKNKRINVRKRFFLKQTINKIDKALAALTNKRRHKLPIIRSERGDIIRVLQTSKG